MGDSDLSQISVVAASVFPGKEREFLALFGELTGLFKDRGYGTRQLLQDAGDLRVYYDVCTWANARATERCQADPDVAALRARLGRIVRVRPLVGVSWPVEAQAALEGRTRLERRLGLDRRAADRRVAQRRQKQQPPPSGRDRRKAERRTANRRASHERRALTGRQLRASQQLPAEKLLIAAREARIHAQAAYSKFKVGAALETGEGEIITGCNIENATYGLTVCAERVAMFKALSEGHHSFTRVAVVADTDEPTPPCGACRQILWEFGGDLDVILGDLFEERARYKLSQLLPLPFDGRLLNKDLL